MCHCDCSFRNDTPVHRHNFMNAALVFAVSRHCFFTVIYHSSLSFHCPCPSSQSSLVTIFSLSLITRHCLLTITHHFFSLPITRHYLFTVTFFSPSSITRHFFFFIFIFIATSLVPVLYHSFITPSLFFFHCHISLVTAFILPKDALQCPAPTPLLAKIQTPGWS